MKSGYVAAILFIGLSLCGPVAHAAETTIPLNETLANGDFLKPLSQGWATQAEDLLGEHSITATPENGAVVRKEMCGNATLVQPFEQLGNRGDSSRHVRLGNQSNGINGGHTTKTPGFLPRPEWGFR